MAASRLSEMQARFQQKQMQEKEEKLLRLYENQQQRVFERVGRGSAGSNTSNGSTTSTTSVGGKVRQMFDERRQKAGIDRSYPLEPLKQTKTNGHARVNSIDRLRNNKTTPPTKTVVKTTTQRSITHVKNGKPLINKREVIESVYNNNAGDESYHENTYVNDLLNNRNEDLVKLMNDANLDDEVLPNFEIEDLDEPIFKGKLANVGGKLPSEKANVEKKITMEKTPTKTTTIASPTKNKPIIRKTVAKGRAAVTDLNRSSYFSPTSSLNDMQSARGEGGRGGMGSRGKVSSATPGSRAPSSGRPSQRQTGKSNVVRDDLENCRYCNRRFASDRLQVHEDICARTAKKKRKVYDATKHRVQGTELEPYVKKTGRTPSKNTVAQEVVVPKKQGQKEQPKRTDWRRKHEEFISAIRAAKMAQAHIAKGGKLSDLPPLPPSSNPDYVQCPHCGRKFNPTAAERHIPKCATYEFNKPKPNAARGSTKGSFR